MSLPASLAFGALLKQLRKRAGMTQRDLAAALGYSESFISNLEKAQRQPDLQTVIERFIPALGLQDDPKNATALIEQAALARGERPPTAFTFGRAIQLSTPEEYIAPAAKLPTLPTALIGRDNDVNRLCNRLLGHGGRLLTLVGPPGIGKTTLALAAGAQIQPHYNDGVAFVALAAVNEPTLMATTILGVVSGQALSPPKAKLIEFLRRKVMLLVLDNLEQINNAALFVAELLAECPGLFILATSRERLHLRAEQRYKVPPLDLAPSVELFVRRAQAVDPDFVLTPHNQPTLEAICQRLDCLPLALELCATQIELFSPLQILARLQEDRLSLLVEGAHDLPPRQRTLRTAIEHSYRLLNEAERTLFRTLGIFVGGFALSEVERMVEWRLVNEEQKTATIVAARPLVSILRSLVGKSLVRSEVVASGATRFFLLETIREYALAQVLAHDEEALLRQCHYVTYLHLFRTGDSHLRGAETVPWLARLEPEQDNLRAALQWAMDNARYADVMWLMIACGWFWFMRGQWYENGEWLAQLLPHRHQLPVELQLNLLTSVYAIGRAVEAFQPLSRWQDELLALLEICSNQHLRSAAWYFLGCYASDFVQAAAAWEASIAAARLAAAAPILGPEFCLLTDCDFLLCSPLWTYATELVERGKFAQAMPLLQESQKIYECRESQYELADVFATLGRLAFLQGDLPQAHANLQKAVKTAATFGYQETIGHWQPLLGVVTLYRGDVQEARHLLQESLRLCLALKDRDLLARTSLCLAELALWEGEVKEAEQRLRESLNYYLDPHKIAIDKVEFFLIGARIATAQQQYHRTARLFGVVEQLSNQLDYVYAGAMRPLANASLTTTRSALEPAVFAEAFAAGREMSLEAVFATLLMA